MDRIKVYKELLKKFFAADREYIIASPFVQIYLEELEQIFDSPDPSLVRAELGTYMLKTKALLPMLKQESATFKNEIKLLKELAEELTTIHKDILDEKKDD